MRTTGGQLLGPLRRYTSLILYLAEVSVNNIVVRISAGAAARIPGASHIGARLTGSALRLLIHL